MVIIFVSGPVRLKSHSLQRCRLFRQWDWVWAKPKQQESLSPHQPILCRVELLPTVFRVEIFPQNHPHLMQM